VTNLGGKLNAQVTYFMTVALGAVFSVIESCFCYFAEGQDCVLLYVNMIIYFCCCGRDKFSYTECFMEMNAIRAIMEDHATPVRGLSSCLSIARKFNFHVTH